MKWAGGLWLFALIATGMLSAVFGADGGKSSWKESWVFAGPTNPEYEWTTFSAADAKTVFTVVHGGKWEFVTENGTFQQEGSGIVALDLETGKTRWSYQTKFQINSPLLCAGGRVVAYDVYGNVFCLNAATGKLEWQVNPDTEGMPHPGPWDEQTMPSCKDDRLFLREANELVCRNFADGKTIWKVPVDAVSNRRVFPAITGDKVALSTASDDVMVLNAKDGGVAWKKKIGWLKPDIVANQEWLSFANDDYLQCAQISDGQNVFTYGPKPATMEKKIHAQRPQPLAMAGDRLFILQESTVLWLGDDGATVSEPRGQAIACVDLKARKVLWKFALTDPFAGLSVAGKCAVIVQGNKIAVLDLDKGTVLWQFDVAGEKGLRGQALVVDGKIIVTGQNGMHCIDTGDAALTGWPQCAGSASRSGEPQRVEQERI